MSSPTHVVLTVPVSSLNRPSTALIILHGVMLTHHVAGRGVTLTADDVAAICEALGEIVPAVQTMEAVTAGRIAEAETVQPSADIVFFRPRHAAPSNGGNEA